MCPVCMMTAALIAGSLTSTGGLALIVIKKFGANSSGNHLPAQTTSKEDRHG
jgi:hypothetical protein